MAVVCLICGHEAPKSLQAHINHFHGMVKTEYEALYPGAPILSETFYAVISEKNRELATRPGWSDKVSQGVKKLWKDPEYVKAHSAALKKGQNTPEAKENHRKGFYNHFLNQPEEERENKRQSIIKSWQDPEKRENRVNGLRKVHQSEEGRKKHSDATKKFMAVPENLEARKKKLKEVWAEPENRKKIIEIAKIGSKAALSPIGRENLRKANLRPDVREKRSQAAKKNMHKRMLNKDKYSKLNKFLEDKMNSIGLFPVREHPLGPYFVDFCFIDEKLVIEADGDFWHANPEFLKERGTKILYAVQKKMVILDKAKNTYLKNHGWKLLRFWERDIKSSPEECLRKIQASLK